MRTHNNTRRGSAMIISILALVILAAIAASIGQMGGRQGLITDNQEDLMRARLAAESGVEFALLQMRSFVAPGGRNGIANILEPLSIHFCELYGYENVDDPDSDLGCNGHHEHGKGHLKGKGHLLGRCSRCRVGGGNPVIWDCQDQDFWHEGDTLRIEPRVVSDISEFELLFEVSDTTIVEGVRYASQVQITATGYCGELTQVISMTYDIVKRTDLTHYGAYSSLRLVARGNAQINGPIRSDWGRMLIDRDGEDNDVWNASTRPLDVSLSGDGYISGDLETSLSEDEFRGRMRDGDDDFVHGIRHDDNDVEQDMRGRVRYESDEAPLVTYEDFDTSELKAMTSASNLPDRDDFGDIGAYGIKGNHYQNKNLHNIRLTKGTHARFENCTFTGIVYIEVDEDENTPTKSGQNSVVFDNCTFKGPVITGVPKRMDWRYNCMQFTGDTVFDGDEIEQALGGVTLMAPNYNVNIGGAEGGGDNNSELRGMVIGGCVDLYGTLDIHGTVVSMAEVVRDGEIWVSPGGNENWVKSSGVCGANVGNLDGSGGVTITPNPSLDLPLGMRMNYRLAPASSSYREGP
jgi:hypothetical protein